VIGGGGIRPVRAAHVAAGDARWPLPPRAARTFYNVADAWLPPEPAARDLVAALAPHVREAAECARLVRALRWLEWSPRVLLHSARGLSWLPRDARRAWLDRLERRGPFRRVAIRAHRAVDRANGTGAPAAAHERDARIDPVRGAVRSATSVDGSGAA
jgi:hypothetical protein